MSRGLHVSHCKHTNYNKNNGEDDDDDDDNNNNMKSLYNYI